MAASACEEIPVDRLVRDAMAEGFCVVEVLFDERSQAKDFVIREVNAAFERQTGLVAAQGRRVSELLPGREPPWVHGLAEVVLGGRPVRSEQRSERLGRWFEVQAFRCGSADEHLAGVLFNDVTQRKLDELMARSVVEYAIIMLDPDGRVRTWNAGARRIKGYAPEEVIGQHISLFYTPEDIARGRPQQVLDGAAQSGRFDDEGWRVRRDGSRFWAGVSVTPLRDSDGQLQGYCKVTRDLSDRKRADEALRSEIRERTRAQRELHELNQRLEATVAARTADLTRSNAELGHAKERLQELSLRLIDAQEQERARIGRELHDETGQLLTALRMQLDELPQQDSAALHACKQLVGRTVEQTRRLALNLRPAVLDDLGLDAALEWMLEQQAAPAGWSASYHGGIGEQRFRKEVETACFRIAQEALTNVARHAGATEVSVSVVMKAERLVLTVSDNGRGFELARYQSPQERMKHFGLMSMSERAALLGAQLSIASKVGRGTAVKAIFPAAGE